MQQDFLGNAVTGQRDTTLRSIDDFIEGYLAYETRAEHILVAANADPDSCMANVYAGILWMLLEAPQAASRATKYLTAAELAAPAATRREQLNVAMLPSARGGRVRSAILKSTPAGRTKKCGGRLRRPPRECVELKERLFDGVGWGWLGDSFP
jgi:hypothetical protein